MKKFMLLLLVIVGVAACVADQPAVEVKSAEKTKDAANVAEIAGHQFGDQQIRDRETVFPKSPMPEHLVVIDGQVLSVEMRLMMLSLQGVLAKTEPRLYFDPSTIHYNDPAHEEEGRWLTEMETKWGVTSETASDPWAVLDRFIDDVAGFIVYDPELPQTINVATTLAGIHSGLIAHPDLVGDLTSRGLTQIDDLRDRFADNVELYVWAFANVWPLANQTIISFLDDNLYPLRDYLVRNNIFTMQLDPHHWAERPHLEIILDAMPDNIPILGWPLDELLGVIIFSEYNKFLIACDQVSNLSAHSGLPRPDLSQEHITEYEDVENKIYVSFAYTDGDAINYMNRWMANWFDDPAFGEVPAGWEISANLIDLAPDVIEYFYERLTENDMVIGPACGIGYAYPRVYPDLDTFLALTDEYLREADMRTVWLINDNLTLSDAVADRFGHDLNLLGIFDDYWPTSDKGWYMTSGGTPVVRSRYTYLVGREQIHDILADAAVEKQYLYPDVPTFVFIGVNAWGTNPSYLKSVVDTLDDRYVVLRPDAMFAAMRTAAEQGLIP